MNLEKCRYMILMVLPLWLMGCTQGQESFSTEPGKGYGWKDMTETQKEVHKEMKAEVDQHAIMNPRIPVIPIAHPVTTFASSASAVTRMPEHFMKIWFTPYQDRFGNLHEACAVHTVLQTGQWIVPMVDDTTA